MPDNWHWSEADNQLLTHLREERGLDWNEILAYFPPGMSIHAARKHYYSMRAKSSPIVGLSTPQDSGVRPPRPAGHPDTWGAIALRGEPWPGDPR